MAIFLLIIMYSGMIDFVLLKNFEKFEKKA